MSDAPANKPKVPKHRQMEIGNLDELLADARAAGDKIGRAIPPPSNPPAPGENALPIAPDHPPSAPPHKEQRQSNRTASTAAGKKRRREVRLSLDVSLLIQMQHHCIDEQLLLRDGMEAAIIHYLKQRK